MGDVYKARHRKMERTVALKVINRDLVRKPQAVDRFHWEVKAAAQVRFRDAPVALCGWRKLDEFTNLRTGVVGGGRSIPRGRSGVRLARFQREAPVPVQVDRPRIASG